MTIGGDTTIDKSSSKPAISSPAPSTPAPVIKAELVLSPLQRLTVGVSFLLLLAIAVTNLHDEGWFRYPAPMEMFLKRPPSGMPANFHGGQPGSESTGANGAGPQSTSPGGPPGFNNQQMPPGMGFPPGMPGGQQMPPGMQQMPGQQGMPFNGQMPPYGQAPYGQAPYGMPPGQGTLPQQQGQAGGS